MTMSSSVSFGDDKEKDHLSYASQLVNLTVLPMTLQAVFELGIFEIMARAGLGAKLSPVEIAAQMPTKNPDAPQLLDRILRLLVSYYVLDCSLVADDGGKLPRVYSLNSVSKFFVRDEDGFSLGPLMALIQDKVFMDSWSELKGAILEGGVPFNRVHGMHAFEYPGRDARFNQVFNTAMINSTTLIVKKILETYEGFGNLKELIDVGGGLGVTLNLITSRYPSIRAVNFDLPHVIKHAPSYPGVEHVGGDMFESIPKGEAIFMKWILHDWSDDYCLRLLKNCYDAIPDDGKVIVVEAVLPLLPGNSAADKVIYEADLIMLAQNPGGKERTKDEFLALATETGFSGIRFECKVCNLWVMEFFK